MGAGMSDVECKQAAIDYLKKSGLNTSSAKRMLNCYVNLGKSGTVEIGVNGPGGESSSVRIDAEFVANCKTILRGLSLLEAHK